ncbi:MAG TPA: CCE_0567 family metalloprotein [Rhodopseudomonas sp.]|uniref:CCE_0567 family metalloprotein n=1 Tax=Rhodopseudomonas sp. TaxID=1078 RepID=UPI002EDAE127
MSDVETLKAEIKKLSSRAINAKMNLHDLSEELPVNWQTIMTVAQETHDAYAALEAARKTLKELEAKAA